MKVIIYVVLLCSTINIAVALADHPSIVSELNSRDSERSFEVLSAVCGENGNGSSEPPEMLVPQKLIRAVAKDGEQIKFDLGTTRWPCEVKEVYHRVENLNFKSLRPEENHGPHELGVWAIQLSGVEMGRCSPEIQKQITAFYTPRLGKEETYVRISEVPIDFLSGTPPDIVPLVIQSQMAHPKPIELNLFILTFLDDDSFLKEDLWFGDWIGARSSMRLGKGLSACDSVQQFLLSSGATS
jgi:hypothetical protein